ncbi:helix-turn-helix transcriptional regulator [Gordonia malaquae]|uniref:helix-turn-helix domain-containing protein n=1 Tax=Gordonia malaquae TaxID=410332 RepID=UPI0030C786B9
MRSNVRAEMARLRVSQQKMGAALGWSQDYISRRLTGSVAFTIDELAAVAEYLGVPLSALLGNEVLAVGA